VIAVNTLSASEKMQFNLLQIGDAVEIDGTQFTLKEKESMRGCMCGQCVPPNSTFGLVV